MAAAATIAGRVAEMQASMAAEPPNEVMGAFGREQAALAAEGPPARIAEPGTTVPDADLLDVHGAPTTLYAATGDQPAVLVLYRGAWCPYCNVALSVYQHYLLAPLTARSIGLIAVSPQTPDGALSMQQKHDLGFTVVSDPGNSMAGALGVLTRPTDEAQAAQLQLGLDLTAVNVDGTITLPMPTVAITDADHTLRWIDVHPDYSTRTEPAQVLSALDQLSL
jgi:peroxiredoxin